jgi:hypothetical protein
MLGMIINFKLFKVEQKSNDILQFRQLKDY